MSSVRMQDSAKIVHLFTVDEHNKTRSTTDVEVYSKSLPLNQALLMAATSCLDIIVDNDKTSKEDLTKVARIMVLLQEMSGGHTTTDFSIEDTKG